MPEDKLPVAIAETAARAMVAVLVPYGGAAVMVWDAVRGRLAERMQKTADDIIGEVGADVLAARLADAPQFEALVINALDSAARTGYEAKRRLLSRVVINAALDDARVDECALLEQAVREVEAPHVRALARVHQAWQDRVLTDDDRQLYPGQSDEDILSSVRGDVAYMASRLEPEPVVAVLVRVGAAAPPTILGGGVGIAYITAFGQQILADLSDGKTHGPG